MGTNAAVSEAVELVTTRVEDCVVTLTLNQGDRFNPLSTRMIAALEAALDRVAADRTNRVVVLAGAGRGFCAGHDLRRCGPTPRTRPGRPRSSRAAAG